MAFDDESQAIKATLDAWWRKVEQDFLYGSPSSKPVGFLSNDAVAAGEIVVRDQSIEDALMPMLLGNPIVETDELATPSFTFGGPLLEPENKAVRMFRLWRAGLLPPDVTVVEIPVERTAYGDYRFSIPDYGSPHVAVQDNDTPVKHYDVVQVTLIDVGWGALGWNEHPPYLIVGQEHNLPDNLG